jgi:hypothetical protein
MLQQYDQAMRDHIAKRFNVQQRFEKIFKADAQPNDDDNGDNGEANHVVSEIADLVVEAGGGKVSREAAMHWLLNTAGGRALLVHLKSATNKGTAAMSTFPIHKVARNIAETGVSWLTEQQLTEKIFEHAQRDRRSNETPQQAFARCFSADDEHGRTFRKAVQNARTGTYHPFPR